MEKVYVIFSGQYSDWNVHGFFNNKDEAMKYCAFKNKSKEDSWDEYYVKEIDQIFADVKNIKLCYYHEIVFDYKNKNFVMRDEPDRFDYYIGESKPIHLLQNMRYNWIAIKVNANDRNHAEKIAQDIVGQLLYSSVELGSMDKALIKSGFVNKCQ